MSISLLFKSVFPHLIHRLLHFFLHRCNQVWCIDRCVLLDLTETMMTSHQRHTGRSAHNFLPKWPHILISPAPTQSVLLSRCYFPCNCDCKDTILASLCHPCVGCVAVFYRFVQSNAAFSCTHVCDFCLNQKKSNILQIALNTGTKLKICRAPKEVLDAYSNIWTFFLAVVRCLDFEPGTGSKVRCLICKYRAHPEMAKEGE